MSNTIIKLILVIVLSILLLPFVAGYLILCLFQPILFLVMLVLFMLSYYINKKLDRKNPSLEQNTKDSVLNKILRMYYPIMILYCALVLPYVIVWQPRRMLVFFAVILPVAAIYLKLSEKRKISQTFISNFNKKKS